MATNLTHDEEHYLKQFLTHGVREQHKMHIIANLFLLLGGILIIGTIVYLLKDTTDATILLVAVPGILGGLLLVALYAVLSRKERKDRKLYVIISKLMA